MVAVKRLYYSFIILYSFEAAEAGILNKDFARVGLSMLFLGRTIVNLRCYSFH